jgi:predicted nuclease of predicted toxin-antitoxin system
MTKSLNGHWGESRIIVTTDQDFEEMIWQENRNHAGIVRLENLPRAERLALFQYILDQHKHDLELGTIIIAMSRKIRVRKPTGKL